jgi:hypothetical protein
VSYKLQWEVENRSVASMSLGVHEVEVYLKLIKFKIVK